MERIVVGVATVEALDPVLPAALALARRTGAELHVVHALRALEPHAPVHVRGPDPVDRAKRAIQASLVALDGCERSFAHAGYDSAPRLLAREAERLGASLLVTGRTRRGSLARAILGTTGGEVIRTAHVPILVLRSPIRRDPPRVLLTTDLSSLSEVVHERGLGLAAALLGDRLDLRSLFVLAATFTKGSLAHALEEVEIRDQLAGFLARRTPAGSTVQACLRTGDAAGEIVAEASEWEADLVVLGTHARRGASRFLLGSVAESAIAACEANVLVVPAACLAEHPDPPPSTLPAGAGAR